MLKLMNRITSGKFEEEEEDFCYVGNSCVRRFKKFRIITCVYRLEIRGERDRERGSGGRVRCDKRG